MRGKNVIVINGNAYDAMTGLSLPMSPPASQPQTRRTPAKAVHKPRIFSDIAPVRHGAATRPATTKTPAPASVATPVVTAKPAAAAIARTPARVVHTSLHKTTQRSQTLNRKAIKKPIVTPHRDLVQRSPLISKFSPPSATQQTVNVSKVVAAVQPAAAPAVVAALPVAAPMTPIAKAHAVSKPAPSASSQLKKQLIAESMERADNKADHSKGRGRIRGLLGRKPRLGSALTMVSALVFLGGYLTYVNMPNLSVRVASVRAGVEANFPEYSPSGYRFVGPVAFEPGEVSIRFQSNTNASGYEITQQTSNWDSQAVLDNLVMKKSDSYLTYSERGLTVYTYGNKAAWVNGGVLYTIDGDAPLSNEQVLRIASSL